MKPSIIFFGSPEFAVPAYDLLLQSGYPIKAVVTQPDKPKGRGRKLAPTAIAERAAAENAPLYTTKKVTPEIITQLQQCDAEIGIVVAYGAILPQELIDIFPRGILNIHPSLLPQYRGPSPLQAPILHGDSKTGVTIMLLDAELDHGPILLQKEILLDKTTTTPALHDIAAQKGAEALIEAIDGYSTGVLTPQPQDHRAATFTKKITKEDGVINWHSSCEEIDRHIRAYTGWPGSYTHWNNKKIMIHAALPHAAQTSHDPGTAFLKNNALCIAATDGYFEIETIQIEGKQKNTAAAFLQGHANIIGSTLT